MRLEVSLVAQVPVGGAGEQMSGGWGCGVGGFRASGLLSVSKEVALRGWVGCAVTPSALSFLRVVFSAGPARCTAGACVSPDRRHTDKGPRLGECKAAFEVNTVMA